jgi:hypothetical protein
MATKIPRASERIDAAEACEIANGYLIDNVGDLLMVGAPALSEEGYWTMPILASNAVRGEIGQVGTISVDADSGEVRLSKEDLAEVEASARLLAGTTSP